eukprot:gene7558-biopygen5863
MGRAARWVEVGEGAAAELGEALLPRDRLRHHVRRRRRRRGEPPRRRGGQRRGVARRGGGGRVRSEGRRAGHHHVQQPPRHGRGAAEVVRLHLVLAEGGEPPGRVDGGEGQALRRRRRDEPRDEPVAEPLRRHRRRRQQRLADERGGDVGDEPRSTLG